MSYDFFSPYHCNICVFINEFEDGSEMKPFQRLLSCSGCLLVRYCSAKHQNFDWNVHHEFCLAVQKIKKTYRISHPLFISTPPKSREDIEVSIVQLKYLIRTALKRNLQYQEEEQTSFPAYCPVCFKFQCLKAICSTCHSQAYCTEQHKELHKNEHKKVCNLLQAYYCPYKLEGLNNKTNMVIKGKIDNIQNMDLTEVFEKAFMVKLSEKPYQDLKSYHLFSYASDFSCVLSICYALNQMKVIQNDIAERTIFIVGASIEAFLWFREIHCKLFFVLNPNIKKLNLEFIGPELVGTSYTELKFLIKGKQRSVIFNLFKGPFEEFYNFERVTAHLIVAFNCGFSEFSQHNSGLIQTTQVWNSEEGEEIETKDTWYPGLIQILLTFDTPIIFTSFTEQEAEFDFASLQTAAIKADIQVHIEHIFKITKNPFPDLRPLRQWYAHDKEEFYYRNGYIQAIRTRYANPPIKCQHHFPVYSYMNS